MVMLKTRFLIYLESHTTLFTGKMCQGLEFALKQSENRTFPGGSEDK